MIACMYVMLVICRAYHQHSLTLIVQLMLVIRHNIQKRLLNAFVLITISQPLQRAPEFCGNCQRNSLKDKKPRDVGFYLCVVARQPVVWFIPKEITISLPHLLREKRTHVHKTKSSHSWLVRTPTPSSISSSFKCHFVELG